MSRGTWRNLPRHGCLVALLLAGCWMLVGCGHSDKGASSGTDDGPAKNVGSATDRHSPSDGNEEGGQARKKKDKEEGKLYVGDVPLDVVFMDDPLGVAKDSTPVGKGAVASANPSPAPPVKPDENPAGKNPNPKPEAPSEKKSAAPPVATAAGDWKSIIPGEVIADEVKAIRANMSNSLQKISAYNNSYKVIQSDAAVLSALAGVAANHPDSISWKKDARIVRDLAVEVRKQAKGPANPHFDNTKKAFAKLDDLLSGNRPADLPAAEEKTSFNEVAPRSPLMVRIEFTFNTLKGFSAAESNLKSSSDKAAHEAVILAFLAKVVALPEYDFAEEPEYKKFAGNLIASGQGAATAAKESDLQAFKDALAKGQKTCSECHSNYK